MKGIAEGSLVSLLNGQGCPVENLNNAFFKTPIYVYSLDSKGITVGQVHLEYVGYGQTLNITLDSGEILVVGEDQEFIMRDWSIKAAKLLEPDDALMPLYRKVSEEPQQLVGYELCYDPIRNRNRFSHRIVGSWKYPGQYPKNGYVIHHKDYKKLNNDPNNLILMDKDEHLVLHQDFLRRLLENPEFKEFMREVSRENMSRNWQDPEWGEKVLQARLDAGQRDVGRRVMSKIWEDDEFRLRKSEEMKRNWEDPEWQEKLADVVDRTFKNPEFIQRGVELTKERWNDPEFKEEMSRKLSDVRKKKWQDSDYRKQMVEARRKRSEREKKDRSDVMTRLWKTSEFRDRMKDVGREAAKKAWSNPESASKLRMARRARADAQHRANEERGLTFDTINYAILQGCNSLNKLGKHFKVSHTVIFKSLKYYGVEDPSQYVRTYKNHKILRIKAGDYLDLYQLSVNFACQGVFLNGTNDKS
jgi:hypothetical protein